MIDANSENGRRVQRMQETLWKAKKSDGRLALEVQLRNQIKAAFQIQKVAVLLQLYTGSIKKVSMQTKAVDPLAGTASALSDPLKDGHISAYVLGLKKGAKDIGVDISFTLKNPKAIQYARTVGAERVTNINDYTRVRVRKIVGDGIASGLSVPDIAKILQDQGENGVFSEYRAQMISVTETGDAYVSGNFDFVEEYGEKLDLEQEKKWMAGGPNPCETCLSNESEGWIGLHEDFGSGDDMPLAHPNCACDLQYRVL